MPLDNKTIFFYIIIFIVIVWVFSGMSIGLNIVFGTLVAGAILYWLYKNHKKNKHVENVVTSAQQELVLPDPELGRGYEDVMRHLFSIQNFYPYNPDAYYELVGGFKNFFRIYEDTFIVPRYAGRNYEMMNDQKRKSMNALHSIVFNMPAHYRYTHKLERGIAAIEDVLQKYLDRVEYIQKTYLYENNYNIETKLIDKSGVLARNAHDGQDVPETYGDRFGHHEGAFSYELF